MISLLAAGAWAGLALTGEVRPVSGPPIPGGVVLVEDGRVTAIGAGIAIPEGFDVIAGAVVTPGLVDGLSVAGLSGILNDHATDQDHAERWAVTPALRALDGYNPWEELVGWVRDHGVTTMQVGPSPGSAVAGRALITRTRFAPVDAVALTTDGAMVFTLGDAAKGRDDGPRSRLGAAATVRQALAGAREYLGRRGLALADRPPIDLGQQALAEVVSGQRQAIFVAHRADDLLTALRIGAEFELDLVLAGATEAYLVREAIAEAGVGVLVGPVMVRSPWFSGETRHASWENAALLADAGIRVGFTSGFEGYVPKVRVVLWEAAVAAANGLGPERALEALTLGGATVLGIDDRVGTLQVGRAADAVVFDGDPFEYTSHVCAVVVAGEVVSRTCR